MIKPSPHFLANFLPPEGDWLPFTGDYDKQFCDVRTHGGREFGPCWPNANAFHCVNHDDPNVPTKDIAAVRYYRDNPEGVQP